MPDALDRLRAYACATGTRLVPVELVRAALDQIEGPMLARLERNRHYNRAAALLLPGGTRYGKAKALERALRVWEARRAPLYSPAYLAIAEAFRTGAAPVRTWRKLFDLLD